MGKVTGTVQAGDDVSPDRLVDRSGSRSSSCSRGSRFAPHFCAPRSADARLVARSPDPGRRLWRGNLAHRALSRARIARGALATLRLLPPEAIPRQDDRHRTRRAAATWQPTARSRGVEAEQKPVKLLMLGGSSLWGFGARDDQTIPSLLARKLHERGLKVEVKNLAELGYVSTQEVIGLIRELQTGYRPDVVIFYDGVNDTTSAAAIRRSRPDDQRNQPAARIQSPAIAAAGSPPPWPASSSPTRALLPPCPSRQEPARAVDRGTELAAAR